jgi:ankyrin repeat protein
MADDAMELSKQVYELCDSNASTELEAFLEAHPQVSVILYRDEEDTQALHRAALYGYAACVRMLLDHGADVHACDQGARTALLLTSMCGHLQCVQILIEAKSDVNASSGIGRTAAHYASQYGETKCLQLLIENHADVNTRDITGGTPAMTACESGDLPCLRLLVDHKADLNVRDRSNKDALYKAIGSTHRTLASAVLCCDTDAKNVKIDEGYVYDDSRRVTEAKVAACIEDYTHTQAYIDEYHRVLNLVLSEHVPVDPRFGLGQMGIYQEPLERTLEYLGLSMNKDQVVNTSIDGDTKRALIPSHVLNAKVWYDMKNINIRLRDSLIAEISEREEGIRVREADIRQYQEEIRERQAKLDALVV